MSDDRERELLYEVRQAMGDLYHEDDVMNVFQLVEKQRAAAAAEARDKALREAEARLRERAAIRWESAERLEEAGDDCAEYEEAVAMELEEAIKDIRALRGGGR